MFCYNKCTSEVTLSFDLQISSYDTSDKTLFNQTIYSKICLFPFYAGGISIRPLVNFEDTLFDIMQITGYHKEIIATGVMKSINLDNLC